MASLNRLSSWAVLPSVSKTDFLTFAWEASSIYSSLEENLSISLNGATLTSWRTRSWWPAFLTPRSTWWAPPLETEADMSSLLPRRWIYWRWWDYRGHSMMTRCACSQSIAAKSKVTHATSLAWSRGSMITAGIMMAIAFYDLVLSICKFIIQLRTKCRISEL